MFFLGDFLGDYFSIADTPTNVNRSTSLELEGGLYDELYVGQDSDIHKDASTIPQGFDLTTIMHSQFNDSANAGNIDWSSHDIQALTIQRRKVGTNKWVILESRNINTENGFQFSGVDITAAAATDYEYAVIPYHKDENGNLYQAVVFEEDYKSEYIRSEFNGIFLADTDMIYSTPLTNGFINTSRNIQKSFNTLLNRKYPVACSNSIASYDTGDCTGMWMRFNEFNCQFETDDILRTPYQQAFMDWLTNGRAKILKSQDGRIWLIEVNPSPTDNAVDAYNMREVTFQWTEIGNANNEEDLWYAGLVKADEMWWRGNV